MSQPPTPGNTNSVNTTPPDIVLAPTTPTPPQSPTAFDTEEPSTPTLDGTAHSQHGSYGLGLTNHSHSSLRHSSSQPLLLPSPSTLSPTRVYASPDHGQSQIQLPAMAMDDQPLPTPATAYFTPSLTPDSAGSNNSPFNFAPTSMSKSPVIRAQSNISARRGHRYKHSSSHMSHSMSHTYIPEAVPRPALSLPASLPIPTLAECRASMTTDQKIRLTWSLLHMMVAGHVAWNAHTSAAMEALSHLIFYDSLGALLCVLVEVLSNFEVWSRSSIRHPFGLQRMEVIAGFALSVLLIFFGFDLISHNAKHALEGLGSHEPHHPHSHHDRVSAGTVDFTVLLAITSTFISAVGLKNHARIGKAMRFAAMDKLALPLPLHSVLSNPSHFLTLSCSTTLLLLPLLDLHTYEAIDKILSLSIAFSMLFLGFHLGRNVGGMLLMSYPATGVPAALADIERDPLVHKVDTAKFWQAHYGVAIANLRLRVARADGGALARLRERIVGIVRNRLSGGYGAAYSGGGAAQKWEVSVEIVIDEDDGGAGSGNGTALGGTRRVGAGVTAAGGHAVHCHDHGHRFHQAIES